MTMRGITRIGFALLICSGASTPALAQPAIPWHCIAAGGGRVSGPNGYALEGTIGQFAVGTSSQGTLRAEWGFWPGALASGRCRADFNADGVVNSQDFFDFLNAFFKLAPGADFNADAAINSQDFFDFLAAFFEPC